MQCVAEVKRNIINKTRNRRRKEENDAKKKSVYRVIIILIQLSNIKTIKEMQ